MQTARLALPFIAAAQAQKHVTHNDALQRLDDLVHLSVISRSLSAPPVGPAQGDRYLVPPGATGTWAAHVGMIVAFQDTGWTVYQPAAGWILWDQSAGLALVHNGSTFIPLANITSADQFGINATADPTNRLAVRSAASLFDHNGGNHQLKINKSASAGTASVVFQTAYSGRAEVGLTGDDAFRVRVSANGASWLSALAVDSATGNLGVNTPPGATEKVKIRADQNSVTQIAVENYSTGAQASSGFSVLAANGNYFSAQLFGSSALYQATNATFYIGTNAAKGLFLRTNGLDRLTIAPDGRVSIGTAVASARLAVDGAIRPKSFMVATLPSAATEGVGALLHVADDANGPTIAYSDGTVWRRIYDRAQVG